jgi:hypothetical protein
MVVLVRMRRCGKERDTGRNFCLLASDKTQAPVIVIDDFTWPAQQEHRSPVNSDSFMSMSNLHFLSLLLLSHTAKAKDDRLKLPRPCRTRTHFYLFGG